ncbi:hypothetical protein ACL02U_25745 [Streptomyces sp. MS06]|uniref:hypothetical protein n=1 Tax=Streptomyces sp. MS06 TaxID=3385974 RepID=UPI0039A06BBD
MTSVGFDSAWCATDLGAYRTCRHTYEYYPYGSLPPLDSTRFTGVFPWLGGTGEPVPEQVEMLDRLAEGLSARGLTLPRDFATFQADSKLHDRLDDLRAARRTRMTVPFPPATQRTKVVKAAEEAWRLVNPPPWCADRGTRTPR